MDYYKRVSIVAAFVILAFFVLVIYAFRFDPRNAADKVTKKEYEQLKNDVEILKQNHKDLFPELQKNQETKIIQEEQKRKQVLDENMIINKDQSQPEINLPKEPLIEKNHQRLPENVNLQNNKNKENDPL